MRVLKSSSYKTVRHPARLRSGLNNSVAGGIAGTGSAGAGPDLKDLRYVPYDGSDQTTWLIPDKPLRAAEGLISDKSIVAKGDVVAYSDGGGETPESPIYLNDLADVDTSGVQNGQVLVFDAAKNRYVFKDMQTGGISEVYWEDIIDKPAEFTPSKHTHEFSDITTYIDAGEY